MAGPEGNLERGCEFAPCGPVQEVTDFVAGGVGGEPVAELMLAEIAELLVSGVEPAEQADG